MKKLFLLAALIMAFAPVAISQPLVDGNPQTMGDPLTVIVTIVVSAIVGAISRHVEKKKLRKAGKLMDKPL